MTATVILFLLLLAMASVLIYHLARWLVGRFFRLRRNVFYIVCISSAAVFFAAVCTGGIFALNALRGAEYARGLADGTASTFVHATISSDAQKELTDQAWQDGYSEGYNAGFADVSAIMEDDEVLPSVEHDLSGQNQSERDTQDSTLPDTNEPNDVSTSDGDTTDPSYEPVSGSEEPSGTEDGSTSSKEESGMATEPGSSTIPAGTTVYYTANGSVLHRDRNCSYLKKAKEILECDAVDAPDLPPCSRCG